MSLLDKASLIITPNAYKESKLYSVIPSNGDGDMTVVRATSATRVNSDGLIEVVPRNLLNYSEDFSQSNWTKSNVTLTSDFAVAPDGTNTASKILANASDSLLQNTISITSGTTYTLSVYLKTVSGNLNTNISLGSPAFPDTQGDGGRTKEIIVTDSWQRFTITSTADATANSGVGVGGFSSFSTGEEVLVWGAQLEAGSTATSYFPTTDRLNIPRIDYTGGGCPSILVEPQRTNLVTYSEQFDNASWVKTRATVTSNATTSPDGTITADKFIPSVDNNTHILEKAGLTVTAQIYTATLYAKKAEYDTIRINMTNYWSPVPQVSFNLTTKTTFDASNATGIITELSDGWFKLNVIATVNPGAGGNGKLLIYAGNDEEFFLTGDGTSGIYIWGAQLEAGSYPTSYIPTTSAAVTRNADVISKTGISGLIGQTEGTWYYEGIINNTNSEFQILTSARNISNTIAITRQTSNRVRARIWSNSTLSLDITSGSNVFLNTKSKIALSYVSGNVNLFYNGILVGSSTNSFAFSSNVDTIELSAMVNFFGNSLNTSNMDSVLIFKTALTDEECINLTTL